MKMKSILYNIMKAIVIVWSVIGIVYYLYEIFYTPNPNTTTLPKEIVYAMEDELSYYKNKCDSLTLYYEHKIDSLTKIKNKVVIRYEKQIESFNDVSVVDNDSIISFIATKIHN